MTLLGLSLSKSLEQFGFGVLTCYELVAINRKAEFPAPGE